MPNALQTLSGALVAQRTLDYLKEMFPPALRLFVDFTDQRVLLNQAINTRIPGVSAAYDASTGYSPKDVTDVAASVTADKFKAVSAKFSPTELSSTARDLVDEHAVALANRLGEALMDDLFGIVLAAAYTDATSEDAANYDSETIRGIRKKMSIRKVPTAGRLGVINADAFATLTGDARVVTLDSNPEAHNQFSNAPAMIRMGGFDIMEYAQLPANAHDLNGVFMAPGAILGAVGIPRDANEAGYWDDVPANALVVPVTDADTGLTLLSRRTRHADGSAQLDLAWIYGFAKGNPALLERVTEAA
jgi:hypothetical protein